MQTRPTYPALYVEPLPPHAGGSEGPYFVQRLSQADSGLVELMLPDGGSGLIW